MNESAEGKGNRAQTKIASISLNANLAKYRGAEKPDGTEIINIRKHTGSVQIVITVSGPKTENV